MKKKYNLALLPTTKNEEIVSISHVFSNMADKYLLGEKSLPHVTLYQFETEEDGLNALWQKLWGLWDERLMNLRFDKFSCLTFDNNIYWVSLLPNNLAELHKMHRNIADIIGEPIRKNFDPHMTLINTKNKDYEKEVNKFSDFYRPIEDIFILKLGKCDEIGQFTEIVY